MISKAPMRIAFAILLSPLIIFLLAQPLWAPLVAQHLLNQKFAEINQYLEQRNLALDSMITHQVQSLTFTCNNHDLQLIRDPQFYNRFVRLIGIENAQGDGCSTIGYPIALAEDSSAAEPTGFTLSATPKTKRLHENC